MLCIQRTEHRRGISLIFPFLLSLKWWPKVIKGIKFLSRIGTSVSWWFQTLVPTWSRRTTTLTLDVHFKNLREFSEVGRDTEYRLLQVQLLLAFQDGPLLQSQKIKTSLSNSWNVLEILHRSRRKISFSLPIRNVSMRSYHCARKSEKQHFLFITAIQHPG